MRLFCNFNASTDKHRIDSVVMDGKVTYLSSLGPTNMDSVSGNTLNVAKLLVGRIDLWVAGLI